MDSTNAALLRLIKEEAPEGTVVVADAQNAGRGRLGKQWFSPPGVNLHLSVFLKPPIQLLKPASIRSLAPLAIADAIEAHGVKTQVKWPNDVLISDKKIGGVLAEVQTRDGRLEFLILGIGVNVNIDRPSMDRVFGDVAPGATSLHEVLGRTTDRNALCGSFAREPRTAAL